MSKFGFQFQVPRYELFAYFYGLQTLSGVSQSWFDPYRLPFLFLSAFLLFFPNILSLLFLISIWQIILTIIKMPKVPNHYIILLVFNLIILVSYLHLKLKSKFSKKNLIDEIAPVARWILICIYFFAFFHKLNWGFFDPKTSCAIFIYNIELPKFGLSLLSNPGRIFSYLIINFVLITELFIPILLIFKKTRGYGVLLAIFFHTLLGISHYVFSTLIWMFLVFFLPEQFFLKLKAITSDLYKKWQFPIGALVTGLLLVYFLLFFFQNDSILPTFWKSPFYKYEPIAWIILSSGVLVSYLFLSFSGNQKIQFKSGERYFNVKWKPLWIFMVIIIVNGISPYVGIKTANSFNMFSNLVTEGGISNHFIIPNKKFEIFDYQDDLILITGTNVISLYPLVQQRVPIPYFELRRRISELASEGISNVKISFIKNGESIFLNNAENHPYLSRPPPWIQRKIMYFRDNFQIALNPNYRCSW